MVKRASKQKTPKRKPGARLPGVGGRPLIDPGDLRAERFGFRLHADLYDAMTRAAREEGIRLSMWAERACIEKVHRQAGKPVLDNIGRYLANSPVRR